MFDYGSGVCRWRCCGLCKMLSINRWVFVFDVWLRGREASCGASFWMRIAHEHVPEQMAIAKCVVPVATPKKSSRCAASERAALRALHARGVYFRPLSQKPIPTEDDVSERLAFAKKLATKSAAMVGHTRPHGH